MTIGKKIALGIASVLFLMIVIAVWSILGIGNIVDDATEVIYGRMVSENYALVFKFNWG